MSSRLSRDEIESLAGHRLLGRRLNLNQFNRRPDMCSEPGHDQVAADPAGAQPGPSRAGQVAVITGGPAGLVDQLSRAAGLPGGQRGGHLAGLPAAAIPVRAAGYGRILTMASALGLACAAARAGYAASKGAVVQLTRSLAAEVRLGRWAEPAEFTDPASRYLTGVILPVDGGWTAH